jgi:ATP-dependent RNA helicase RhlE
MISSDVHRQGTGKTAAFAIPVLQILHERNQNKGYRHIRSLILTPTRELAIQINDSFAAYGQHTGLKHEVIYGGVSQHTQTLPCVMERISWLLHPVVYLT